jgi:hypothetical protein
MAVLTNPRHEQFAQHLAKGLSAAAAYSQVYGEKDGARQCASRLLTNVDVANRVIELQKGIASGMIQAEISERNARVGILQELVDGARRLIHARGQEMAGEVGGADTGLLVKDYKGKDANQVVYKADVALMGRIESHLREASVQLGQRITKTETTTFDAVAMVKMLHEGRARAREHYEARVLACAQSAITVDVEPAKSGN